MSGGLGAVFDVTIDAAIEEAARRLAQASPDARIYLFGSHARGDADRRSDLDLLVVEPEVEMLRGNPSA